MTKMKYVSHLTINNIRAYCLATVSSLHDMCVVTAQEMTCQLGSPIQGSEFVLGHK